MKLIKLQDVQPYEPPGQFDVSCMKVQGIDESGGTKFWQGLSKFAPTGGAEWQYGEGTFGVHTEKTYFVIEGAITVENEAGDQFVVEKFDSMSILPNEKHKLWNSGDSDAVVLQSQPKGLGKF